MRLEDVITPKQLEELIQEERKDITLIKERQALVSDEFIKVLVKNTSDNIQASGMFRMLAYIQCQLQKIPQETA